MLRAVKIRLYPNKEQATKFNKLLGCYRVVYNQCLNRKIESYKKEGKTEQEIKLDIKNTYLERHSYNNSDFSSYFNNITPTVDYTLAQYINTLANKILTSDEILQKIK